MLRATASRPWTSPTCRWMDIQGWLCFLSEGCGQKGCADFDADMKADMAELVAIAFEKPDEADRVLTELARLQKEYLIDLEDAVVAIRLPDGEVQLKQSINLIGVGAASGGLRGALWGSLVGLLFLNPLAGFAVGGLVGAGSGALSGSLIDYGIDDKFIRSLAEALQPNNSALFVLVRKAQPDKVLAELSRFRGKILHSSLAPEQEARLQAAISEKASTQASAAT
jgi:uncharacterized membrane protein